MLAITFSFSFGIDLAQLDYYTSMKRQQQRMGDPVDRMGVPKPPPNESLEAFYIIIKNLRPATARLDAYDAIPESRLKDLLGMEEERVNPMSLNIYISFASISAASAVLHQLPPYIRGRQVWFGHAASKYV